MVYRTLSIGTNEGSDLCLSKFDSKCEFVSSKHACIFYDEYSNHYELLNYSENGTIVDNILFSNDTSLKSNNLGDEDIEDDLSDSSNSLGGSSCDSIKISKNHKMSSKLGKNYWSCKCKCSFTDLFDGKCWEGSAILSHGSHLKFGCLEFIFCLIHYDESSINKVKECT